MGCNLNCNCIPSQSNVSTNISVPQEQVKKLTEMYGQAIEHAKNEARMWSDIQRETSQAITARFKGGQINEKTAMILQLMNDAMAHKTYSRCEGEIARAEHRLFNLKSYAPEYFESKKVG